MVVYKSLVTLCFPPTRGLCPGNLIWMLQSDGFESRGGSDHDSKTVKGTNAEVTMMWCFCMWSSGTPSCTMMCTPVLGSKVRYICINF